jgi:hypothetical protein
VEREYAIAKSREKETTKMRSRSDQKERQTRGRPFGQQVTRLMTTRRQSFAKQA